MKVQVLKPNRPDFQTMSPIEACQYNVDKYTRLYLSAKGQWKKHFKRELDRYKADLEHWQRKVA